MSSKSHEPSENQEMDHPLAHAAEHETSQRQNPVMRYLAILFAAAFLLMLLSFLMQRRASNETIENLKQSVSAMQSVNTLQEEKTALETQTDALENQVAALEEQIDDLTNQNMQLKNDITTNMHSATAMDWFWRIQREVSRGRYNSARKLVEEFQTSGLESSLPTDHPADPDGPSPAEQYQKILELLY